MTQSEMPVSNIQQTYRNPSSDPDEINLLEYAYVLIKAKWWIVGLSFFGLVVGLVAAYIKGPSWVTETVIAPKETETQKAPNLGSLGLLGGMVASQLNLGGNASLDKIDLILDSRRFNAQLAYRYNLLPFIFSKYLDKKTNAWKKDFVPPIDSLSTGIALKGQFLKKETKPNNTMILTIKSNDSLATATITSAYLQFLDEYYRSSVQQNAKENSTYLENQLLTITDPLIRAKLQEMIASEVEKQMLVSKEAFQVLDPPYQKKVFKEKRLYPLVFGAGLFFVSMLWFVLAHALASSQKTDEDKTLISHIKDELFKLPHA
jgi:LPS O-antigen subunit length determinant protein (WzzB/FepE family)